MNKPSIEVTLNADGTVQVAALGCKGKSCEKFTEFIEQALGMSTKNRKRKPEWFTTETTKQEQVT